jgi:hypothetical protein
MRLTASLVILFTITASQPPEAAGSSPSFSWFETFKHEKVPHQYEIRVAGVTGFEILHMRLVISPDGSVINARPTGGRRAKQFWPKVQSEVLTWKFVPFEKRGRAVTARVEERLPTTHVLPPDLKPDSKVTLKLSRGICLGTCPGYRVSVTTEGIEFEGFYYVSATGIHTATVTADAVRNLARRFIDADFYSMDNSYEAEVTDMPAYTLSLDIDGHIKVVKDYAGSWVGMPSVISQLERDVDVFAQTQQWIKGAVNSLKGN